jgi:hypothetical protein
MSVYTVHQPPASPADPLPEAERIVFVRDGFSFWAFLFAPLWMLRHRMWLVLAGYIAIVVLLGTLAIAVDASLGADLVIGLLISLLIGLEASTLRRLTLRRRGWVSAGIVSGDDVEDAERRFFDAWLRDSAARSAAAAPPAPPPATAPARMPRAFRPADVIGLFPDPGAGR